jgi:hypothetical protein
LTRDCPVDDLNERFDTAIELEADTVGGLFTEVAGHIPVVGESVEIEGLRLTVEELQGTRIMKLTVRPAATATDARRGPMRNLTQPDLALLAFAREVKRNSYAPYSDFRVGAAVYASGEIFQGVNVENAAYGSTLCAERSALMAAVAAGCTDIDAVAVVGRLRIADRALWRMSPGRSPSSTPRCA